MRRFNYEENDDNYREEIDNFFSDHRDITDEQFKAEEQMQEVQIKFVSRELNHRVLRTSIRTCEKSFWWWFYSQTTRLKMIEIAYKQLRKLEEE